MMNNNKLVRIKSSLAAAPSKFRFKFNDQYSKMPINNITFLKR